MPNTVAYQGEIPYFDRVEMDCKLSGKNVECSYSNNLISLKIAEFRIPTPQDVEKKGSKILKVPRFAIVLHLQ